MVPALVCVALLGILLFDLGFAVSLTRGRSRVVRIAPQKPLARRNRT